MSEREGVVEPVEVETEAVTTPVPIANSEQPQADLGKVRELVLKAHPDVVPDLVRGSSVDELIASVEPARGAFQRIADQVRTESGVGGGRTSEVGSRKSDDRYRWRRRRSGVASDLRPDRATAGGAGRGRDERGGAGRPGSDDEDRAGVGGAEGTGVMGDGCRGVGVSGCQGKRSCRPPETLTP
jgi:hypothetical protein